MPYLFGTLNARILLIGSDSLVDHDLEEDQLCYGGVLKDLNDPLLLGVEYALDIFAIKKGLVPTYHPKNCLQIQPQVSVMFAIHSTSIPTTDINPRGTIY